MNCLPNFLPPLLGLSGVWEQALKALYAVFVNDFKANPPRHCGLRINYDTRVLPDGHGKEEGFWHVISKQDYSTTGERLIDFRRAERLPWARPLMESDRRVELKVFDYNHGPRDKGIRRYIWLEGFNYVLILQRKKNRFFWITAYYVSRRGGKDLAKRYLNRV